MGVITTFSTDIDNSAGVTTIDWLRAIPDLITIQGGLWVQTGRISLSTRVRIECVDYGNTSRGERYLNPTTSQWGHIALLSDTFVVEQQRIATAKQQITIQHQTIDVIGSSLSYNNSYGKDTSSRNSHYFSVSPINMCISGQAEVVPAPLPSLLQGEGIIGAGGICLRGIPGAEGYTEKDLWPAGTVHELQFGRQELGWFDSLSGVVYPRTYVAIQVDLIVSDTTSLTPPPLRDGIIVGAAPFPVYGYVCTNGFPVPLPLNPACDPLSVGYNIDPVTGQYDPTYGCGSG